MSDLISREDAIKQIEYHQNHKIINKIKTKYALEMVKSSIEELPTAEPKVGRWLDHSDEGYVQCPFCGSLTTCEDNIDELHYCFNCGAKMERSKDE